MVERDLLTLRVPGDGGLRSRVASAGALVSPALISPPSPLDLLRVRVLSTLLGPARGGSLSVVDSRGKASVAVMVAVKSPVMDTYLISYNRNSSPIRKRRHIKGFTSKQRSRIWGYLAQAFPPEN
jgi:hypothetical protein